jgi:hypothetical protein
MSDFSAIHGLLDRLAVKYRSSSVGVGALGRIGLSPAQVRAQLLASAPLTREETKRAMARQVKKGSCGRGGLPDYVIATMFADYQQLSSLSKVGKLYGRSRQVMWEIFSSRNLPLNPRVFKSKTEYNGRSYTPSKDSYLRCTSGDRHQLHHQIWEDNFGPVPPGHQVTFLNANKRDFRLDNLACLPTAEVTLLHHRRHVKERTAA